MSEENIEIDIKDLIKYLESQAKIYEEKAFKSISDSLSVKYMAKSNTYTEIIVYIKKQI